MVKEYDELPKREKLLYIWTFFLQVVFDRLKGMALILYNNIECAQAAVKETKGWKIGGNKIKVQMK